jgi:hypothetical protein
MIAYSHDFMLFAHFVIFWLNENGTGNIDNKIIIACD